MVKNELDITELVAEALWDVFRQRINAVYNIYKDLPKIQELEQKYASLMRKLAEIDIDLRNELESTWSSLACLYEELIYRQGVIESDEYFKSFKELGFIPEAETIGGNGND